jgi:hypothetical protein
VYARPYAGKAVLTTRIWRRSSLAVLR